MYSFTELRDLVSHGAVSENVNGALVSEQGASGHFPAILIHPRQGWLGGFAINTFDQLNCILPEFSCSRSTMVMLSTTPS